METLRDRMEADLKIGGYAPDDRLPGRSRLLEPGVAVGPVFGPHPQEAHLVRRPQEAHLSVESPGRALQTPVGKGVAARPGMG